MTLTEKRHVKAIADLEKAETDLARAFRRWDKLREKVRGYDARADKNGHKYGGGEYDQFASIAAQRLVGGRARRTTTSVR